MTAAVHSGFLLPCSVKCFLLRVTPVGGVVIPSRWGGGDENQCWQCRPSVPGQRWLEEAAPQAGSEG